MNAMLNSPVVVTWGTRDEKQGVCEHNARDRYGCMDPVTWGWRRPTVEEVLAERIAVLERLFAES